MKKSVLLMILLLVLVCAVSLMSPNVTVTVNGEELTGPLKGIVGAGGIVVVPIVLLCVGILLAFIFTGVGLIVLGCLVFACLVSFCATFPFLLPLLIPLFIVWIFCAWARKNTAEKGTDSKHQDDV